MSLSGKLLRGLNWHNFRNLDGVYHKDILTDINKMEELNFYLDFVKEGVELRREAGISDEDIFKEIQKTLKDL